MPATVSPNAKDSSKAHPLRLASLLLAEATWGFLVAWVLSKTQHWYGCDLSATRPGRVIFTIALAGSGYLCGTYHPKHTWLFGPVSAAIPIAILAAGLIRDIERNPTSHNLWPFEVVFYPLLAVPAWIGASIGARMARRRNGN